MQAAIEGPMIQQGRLEALPQIMNTRVIAFTKKEGTGTSNVGTGQTLVNFRTARVLFDTNATHSFISTSFTGTLDRPLGCIGT